MMYTDKNRGKITCPNRAKQLTDWHGIRYENITPTDTDGWFELRDKIYVYYELKYANAEWADGQRNAFVNQANRIQNGGADAVVFLCRHNVSNPEEIIDGASTIVEKYYYNHEWHGVGNKTAKEMTDAFIAYIERKHGKILKGN